MIYQHVRLPFILKVKKDVLNDFEKILTNHNLYFANHILITTRRLHQLYAEKLQKIPFQKVLYIKQPTIEEIERYKQEDIPPNALIIGFGGGKVIDLAKYFATIQQRPYLSIPSTLSNDGIYSPIARLNKNGKKESFGVDCPLGILIDTAIVMQSPKINLLAGVGDLISNLSALEDWKLANKEHKEEINDFAYTLSYLAAQSILGYSEKDLFTEEFIKKLSYGLVLSGFAMEIAKNSRPASGAEHQISHAIDYLYPERATLHGLQVAYGCLLLEQRLGITFSISYSGFLSQIGLLKEIKQHLSFTEEETQKILTTAKTIRDRYTVLNKHKSF